MYLLNQDVHCIGSLIVKEKDRKRLYLFPAVLFETVEEVICVGEPEGQNFKILLVALKS